MVVSYTPDFHPSVPDEVTRLQKIVSALARKNQLLSEKVKQLIMTEHNLYASQTRLDQQVHIYHKLYELGKALNQTFQIDEVLGSAVSFAIYELGFERCLLLLFNPVLDAFEVKAFDGYYDEALTSQIQSLTFSKNDPVAQRLVKGKDYEICPKGCEDNFLERWRSRLCMDEYIAFTLRRKKDAPLGLLIAGNTAERAAYHTPADQEAECFVGLANVVSQITTAIISVSFYQALEQERSLLEKHVQARTQDLNQKNKSLEVAMRELKVTQAQLVQSEKMSGLGHLVAGIAHEINNPVNFIFGNLDHAEEYTQYLLALVHLYQSHDSAPHPDVIEKQEEIDLDFLAEDLPKIMKSMKTGADRIRKIVLSLRTFSRMDEAEMKQVDIHSGIDSTLLILERELSQSKCPIEVIKHYGKLPQIECYAGQLNQVFLNILGNAIDALQSHSAVLQQASTTGKITITTAAYGDCVSILIADNGPGIPAAVRHNIFDPFFTTKPVGTGNGLGLSISYQVVCDRHGGSLQCESTEGQGTCFLIKIPTALKK